MAARILKLFFFASLLLFFSCSGSEGGEKDAASKGGTDSNSPSDPDDSTPPISGSFSVGTLDNGAHTGTQLNGSNEVIPSLNYAYELQNGGFDLTNLVAVWNLNEDPTNNSSIVDSSGNGLTGTFTTAAGGSHGASGQLLGAIEFHGATNPAQKITIPSSAAIDDLAQISISAWVYPHNLGNGDLGTIVAKCSAPGSCGAPDQITNGWHFGFADNAGATRLMFQVGAGASDLRLFTSDNAIRLNEWNHVAVTFAGPMDPWEINLYVNGQLQTVGGQVNGNGRPTDAGSPLYIGAGPTDGEFDGLIDEVGLWSRELSASEISTIYETQSKKYKGEFVSEIYDAASIASWDNLSVTTDRPVLKPLSASTESLYSTGNINTSNLLYYLSMDGTQGSSVSTVANAITEQGPTGITGTAIDADSSMNYVQGKISQGINFDGSEDHIVVDNHASLDITGTSISLMAWVRISKSCCDSGYSRIISKRTDSGGSDVYALAIDNTSTKQVVFRINGSTDVGGSIPVGVWTHVAGVYDGIDKRIYVNGSLVGSPNAETSAINSSARAVHIGMREAENRYFDGRLDEVAIFDRALSASEISDIYLRGKNQFKYQLRSCDDENCAGESYKGPDGTDATYYSEALNFTASPSSFDISGLASNRYIQFKAIIDEVDTTNPPKIMSFEIEGDR